MIVQVVDEAAEVTPELWDYLEERRRRPMQLGTFFRLQAEAAARRLDAFEQQLQRRRMVQEHQAAVIARRLAKWDAVEAASPYRSELVH